MTELAKRAVACKGWRWMPGMHDRWGRCAVNDCAGGVRWVNPYNPADQHEPEHWPDFDDPATLGCLLALVREAWGDPVLSVTACYTKDRRVEWEVEHPHPDSLPEALWTYFDTEAEALVAALEAAP